MTYSGWEIFEKLNANAATTTKLDAAQVASHKLKVIHEDITKSMESSQTALSSFWKGKAADSGAAGLAPLIQTSKTASENMDRARQSMFDQNASFHHTRGAVVPVKKERVGDWGPGDILSIGASNDEKEAAKFDADTKHNVEVYEPYWKDTQPRKDALAGTYPAAHDPNVSATPITADPIDTGTGGKTHTSGFTGGTSGGHQGSSGGYTGGPSTYTAPPGASNYVAPPISRPPVAPPRAPMVPPPGMRRPNDGTDLSWAKDRPGPNPPGGFMPPGSFGPGGDSSGSGGGGFGPGGGGGFGPGAGGFGPGGGGAGSGSAPGAGNATGARAPGMSAAEGMGRGGPMGGAAGAGKPGAGMGGMGSGAGKGGKGGEDEEHQRKILLPEEDPDSIFGGYDGDKPTPPVIGA